MKKYVVNGGAGFIGSHIAEYLLQMGNEVTVVDNLRTGFDKNIKALKNDPITIYGDGSQTRDFIYVKDVVKANILVSEKGNETYNVALGYSTSILELAQKIKEITNSKSEIQFLEERAGDIKHSKANPSKFNELEFKPQYTFNQALLGTITFYENELLVN